MPETINIAELVSDLRLLKDKVAALEKTNATLASALTRTVEVAIEKADKKLNRGLDDFAAAVADRVKSIGDAIDARFGEKLKVAEHTAHRLEFTITETLRVAADAKGIAEAATKSAEEVKLFSAKLDLLDDRLKRQNERLELLKKFLEDSNKPKAQEPAKINRR